ncbi:MAG: HD-GYP domain-containing protein [Bdellovibrio sp.]|nr:HD-GYP domain-containing protein [Bdellovibrio sp.]
MGDSHSAAIIFGEIPAWAEEVALTLLKALRERDPYTYGHCRRVARNARLLARAAGLSLREQIIIEYSSLFHDLGKIGIPDSILLKPGRLSPSEEAIMRTHPVKSAEIMDPLARVPFFRTLLPGIRHHHERMDGQGYPDHIQGDNIPLTARVILIADTYDAMTTNRPYRKGRAEEFAYKELKQFAGRQFDPHLVQIFLKSHPHWGQLEEEITEGFIASHFKRAA